MATTTAAANGRKILWKGPLFARLLRVATTKGSTVQEWLRESGWVVVERQPSATTTDNDNDNNVCHDVEAFIWPEKSGPDFPMDRLAPAYIRPYPRAVTDLVDNKLHFQSLLEGTGIIPGSCTNADDLIDSDLYYVKHCRGAQGKSVYCLNGQELRGDWHSYHRKKGFVIQRAVDPPLLDDTGRKFVLRAHVLIFQRSNGQQPLRSFLHKNVVYQAHSEPYTKETSNNRSVHISNASKKKGLPRPKLLSEMLPAAEEHDLFANLQATCRVFLETYRNHLPQPTVPHLTCFALLGLDCLVSSSPTKPVFICEANSHPALGWGTMQHCDKQVFQTLVVDTLKLLHNDDDDNSVASTGFVKLT